jgi:hypothetical protein
MTVLNVGHFGGFGLGQCPETPRRSGVQARPETPHRLQLSGLFVSYMCGTPRTGLSHRSPPQDTEAESPAKSLCALCALCGYVFSIYPRCDSRSMFAEMVASTAKPGD